MLRKTIKSSLPPVSRNVRNDTPASSFKTRATFVSLSRCRPALSGSSNVTTRCLRSRQAHINRACQRRRNHTDQSDDSNEIDQQQLEELVRTYSSPVARRAWTEVNLDNVLHNFRVAHYLTKLPVMAIIKGDAYGHGLKQVASALEGEPGLKYFGVANVIEARRLKSCGLQTPIFLLGPVNNTERLDVVKEGWTATVSTVEEAHHFNAIGALFRRNAQVHLYLDTGMGRAGLLPRHAVDAVHELSLLPNVDFTGVMTHLSKPDEDRRFTEEQILQFDETVAQMRFSLWSHRTERKQADFHALNSAGLLGFWSNEHNLVRAGLMLYGISPLPQYQQLLKPTLSMKAVVSVVRDLPAGHGISYGRTCVLQQRTSVATVGIGYADGFTRHISNTGACVMIRGKRCPILGRLTMDQTMVDVTKVPSVRVGDEVEIFGEQIRIEELARRANTVPWEIMTMSGMARGGRVYNEVLYSTASVKKHDDTTTHGPERMVFDMSS